MFKIKYKDQYQVFWKSFEKIFARITSQRNNIVHWGTSVEIGDNNSYTTKLVHQNYLEFNKDSQTITKKDMQDFITLCDLVSRILNILSVYLDKQIDKSMPAKELADWRNQWRIIFESELEYPLQKTHPLFPTLKKFT
jgi:hypothetical protein